MKIQAISDNISGYQLLEALPAAIYTCDALGFIQVFNAAAVELWGMKPRPGVDKWCGSWKLFKPDGSPLPHSECPMARALQEGVAIEGEEIIVEKPNGERRFIRPYPRPIFDDLGNVSGAVNMLIDITASKRMENDMAHFAAIVQSSEDAIISKNLDGIVTSWNPAAEKMFGYTAEEMIGKPIMRLIPPDRLDEEVYIINRISSGERVEHFTTLRQTKDKRLIDISLTISPIKDSRGRIIGASKIARDITKSKLEEQRLIQSERNLNELANAMPQLVWINDAAGNTIYFNDRFEEYGAQPVDGPGWRALIHPDDLAATKEEWEFASKSGVKLVMEHRFRVADGEYRWHLTRNIPYRDEQGNITKWIGTSTDIDDMKRMAIRKDDFLSVASHELRTPITLIKAYSQLLRDAYRNSDDTFLSNALTKLETQSNKMTKLVTDFLKLSKIESGKLQLSPEKFFIDDLVKEISSEIQFVSVNHKIIVEDSQKVGVNADKERISQVIANFLNNAIKYSPGADTVMVSITAIGSQVKVSIKDKGIGIRPEDHQKIFERFYRAKSTGIPFSGFGIGLYISAEIIRLHKGDIGVESEFGKGSTFYFTLPIAE